MKSANLWEEPVDEERVANTGVDVEQAKKLIEEITTDTVYTNEICTQPHIINNRVYVGNIAYFIYFSEEASRDLIPYVNELCKGIHGNTKNRRAKVISGILEHFSDVGLSHFSDGEDAVIEVPDVNELQARRDEWNKKKHKPDSIQRYYFDKNGHVVNLGFLLNILTTIKNVRIKRYGDFIYSFKGSNGEAGLLGLTNGNENL